MRRFFIKLYKVIGFFVLAGCVTFGKDTDSGTRYPVDYVNPLIGNISHLLVPTFPTIHLPNSFLRVYPERADFTADLLNGLPLVVTSHRGSSAFNLSPFQGKQEDLQPVIRYSYDMEKITPYSYSVYLDENNIQVNYGLSHQSGMYNLSFEKIDPVYLIINSKRGNLNWDGRVLSGYQLLENDTKVFIYLVAQELPQKVSELKNGILSESLSSEGRNACLVFTYPSGTANLKISYGISFISENQAKNNMEREISGKNIEDIHRDGRRIWNDALGKIVVTGGTENDMTIFYSSLYRCFERPVCISEDGKYYSAFDKSVHEDHGRPFYTDDWIWDSYRAHHPLRILIDPEKEENIIHSFVLMAEQMDNFWLPTFPEITGDSRRMNSNHAVASVLDAHKKGLKNFNLEQAYFASKNAITEKTLAPWSGKPAGELDHFYKNFGYIPALREDEPETIPEVHPFERRQPVAVTLGTAYDQWCLSELAKDVGKSEDAGYFLKASYNYRNLFNPDTKFFHPKDKNGLFIEPFDYKFSGGMGARGYYGENNAWIYRWDVQHNIADLIDMMGGHDLFIKYLDDMFSEPLGKSKYAFYAQLPDHTGNVGQFSMANEPSLHIPYLYNYAGQPWKTQKRIRMLLNQWFRNDLMGVPGDEDGGGMSSFVVFSYLGFYPVTPGMPVYTIGSPVFDHAKVDLGDNKYFEVETVSNSPENKYIQSAILNGETWDRPWFSHADLANGGKLILHMGPKANKDWGAKLENVPPSVGSMNAE